MSIFKRRSWTTIWSEFHKAQIIQFKQPYELECKIIVQVKERRNGSYKIRAFFESIAGDYLSDTDWEYLLKLTIDEGDDTLRQAILKYNIEI